MSKHLLRRLEPTQHSTPKGVIWLSNPTTTDIKRIIQILDHEGLDTRRLTPIKQNTYSTISERAFSKLWEKTIYTFIKTFPSEQKMMQDIKIQMKNIQHYSAFPKKGTLIRDPFHMDHIERSTKMHILQKEQIENSIIAKHKNIIVSFGRLLEVEGSVEIVSLWTRPGWRRLGIASTIIDLLMRHALRFPIFSFQVVPLVPFYLRAYSKYKKSRVAPYRFIPAPLQRDLFYINAFWGPNTIIRIG